ncbi:MAG: PIN domain-containing protein [Myxococcales bacterium]|nr:MAG: PIN domain-containing protein [Myxococcales bacterium]
MNGEGVLLDSVILIDHFNGIDPATQFIIQNADRMAISATTRAEVLSGFTEPALSKAKSLLNEIALIPIDTAIADLGATLRRIYKWKLPDALQAAVATHYGLALATRNTKDFSPDEHAFVHVPYSL